VQTHNLASYIYYSVNFFVIHGLMLQHFLKTRSSFIAQHGLV